MKRTTWLVAGAIAAMLIAGPVRAQSVDIYREQTQSQKMLRKLGRGITNVLTCWVEVPKAVAAKWEQMDPISGTIVGSLQGLGWGFTRFASGVYDAVTFPFPVPKDYEPLIEPEFIITDTWGAPIPGITEFSSLDADRPVTQPIYPSRSFENY